MKITTALLALFLAVSVSGCATIADAKSAKGTGSSQYFDSDYDSVWSAALIAVDSSKLDLISENKLTGEILAQKAMSAFSYGENVAVYVEQHEGVNRVRVEVISVRSLKTNITAKNWEDDLLESITKQLN